jgi:hypothetical protein
MQELFSQRVLTAPEQLREMEHVPKEVSAEYQKLLSQNPARRLNPNKVLHTCAHHALLMPVLHLMSQDGSMWPNCTVFRE